MPQVSQVTGFPAIRMREISTHQSGLGSGGFTEFIFVNCSHILQACLYCRIGGLIERNGFKLKREPAIWSRPRSQMTIDFGRAVHLDSDAVKVYA